jgi:hypothetical protein
MEESEELPPPQAERARAEAEARAMSAEVVRNPVMFRATKRRDHEMLRPG